MRSYANTPGVSAVIRKALWTAAGGLFVVLLGGYTPAGAQALEWGRFRVSPRLSILESYSDNIYLTHDNKEDDFYTKVTPEIAFDFALAPRNYITLRYVGDFYYFNQADNFDSQAHLGEASWQMETAKGSRLAAGASIADTSVQPYGPTAVSRDYKLNTYYGEALVMAGAVTELGGRYEHATRRFDETRFQIDDYDRDQVDLSFVYSRSQILPLLLQYRFVRQDNEDTIEAGLPVNRDFVTHSAFTGARWRATQKISGALRVGYTWSDFEDDQIEEFSGFGMDIDLVYRFSPITRIGLIGRRLLQPVTFAERETGTYYVLTSGGVRLTHHRWEKITTALSYFYHNRDFRPVDRVDREHVAGASIEYALQRWLSVVLSYQYRNNNSDRIDTDFTENLVQLGVSLSI